MTITTTENEDKSIPSFNFGSNFISSTTPDTYELLTKPIRIVKTDSSLTGTGSINHSTSSKATTAELLYPHLFDEETQSGEMLVLVRRALEDVESAIESFSIPDLQAVSTYLTNISALMSTAHEKITFNKSLSALVSFLRRATLVTPTNDISRSTLNSLANALRTIINNPMLDLDDASIQVDHLSDEGWQGEVESIELLIADILADIEEAQASLFID